MKTKNIWVEAISDIRNVLGKIKARPLVRDTITTTIFSTTGERGKLKKTISARTYERILLGESQARKLENVIKNVINN